MPSFDELQEQLAALDANINDNQGFGLMGMLEAQDRQQREQQSAQETQQPAETKEPEDNAIPAWVEPLNTSIQVMNQRNDQRFSSLEQKLSQFGQSSPGATPGLDNEEVDPMLQELQSVKGTISRLAVDQAYERARNSLNSFRQSHPDTPLTEQDLQAVWQKNGLSNNVAAAQNADWNGYFELEHAARVRPALEQRLKDLEAENARLKNGGGSALQNMSAVPAARRTGPAPQAAQSNDGVNEAVYQRAMKRMGPNGFKGFGRIVFEEQQKEMMRSAS